MFRVKIDLTDQAFSRYIRKRDKWTCQRCGRFFPLDDDGGMTERGRLQCSHYIGRGNQATRMDPENCMALCMGCHSYLETRKPTEYRELMIRRLGKAKHDALLVRSKQSKPVTKKDKLALRQKFLKLYNELEEYWPEI